MKQITICYEFCFKLEVRKKNRRTYRNHYATPSGTSCSAALWEIYFDYKRKKTTILKICEVKATGIAFALHDGAFVQLRLSDHPPEIPTDLNAELLRLPQAK